MEASHPEVIAREKNEVGKDITNTNGLNDKMANMQIGEHLKDQKEEVQEPEPPKKVRNYDLKENMDTGEKFYQW